MDLARWLQQQGLTHLEKPLLEAGIDVDVLGDLENADLIELGLNLGDRKRLLKAISSADPIAATSGVEYPALAPAIVTHSSAERRQLTIMFCDLVGSTDLSGRLDPEDLREVVRAYQKTAEEVIRQYGGYIAQYLGDGLLVYFGYPIAHEDDAQRAVYAGVGIPKAIDALNTNLRTDYSVSLAVRIGIHTGPVVVGEMGGNERQENLAMGETPNLAARLEGLAEPNAVVISENTRRLLGELFALTPLGEQNLKGITAPVKAFAVTGERLAETRFAAGQSDGVSTMVGRQQELALLVDRWRQAKAGEAQMVVLTGEAGIGKSRIMSALIQSVEPEDHLRISYQCSPYHTDSALFPAVQQLTYAAGFVADESPESKLGKLEQLLHQSGDEVAVAASLLGALIGLGEVAEARHGTHELSPQERRQQTLQALLAQWTGAAATRPVLFVLEDAHWIDPTTLELIELALDQIDGHRIMLLITARPTFNHGFGDHPIVSRLALNRLGREQIIEIVDRITKGKALPPELFDEIAAKTDGVPLFVEEFTKTLLESGQLSETDQGFEFDGRLDQLTIPSSLHDSLMARLDRMQPIKEVAQAAACIGREFGYALLAAVSPLPQAELTAALDQLVTAELIFKRGVPPESTYTFKHALVRDAAYESLLKARRQTIHDGLLAHLEAAGDAAFQILAHHAAQAGRMLEAASYWEQAGDQTFNRPALSEAASQFERAVQCLRSLRESDENKLRQLDMQVKLTHVAMARYGHAHPITVAANVASRALLDSVGETPHRFPVLYSSYAVKFVVGEHRSALTEANAMCDEAERNADRVQKLIAYRVRGASQVMMGDFRSGESTLEHAFGHFDPDQDTRFAWQYGNDHVDTLQLYRAFSSLIRGEAQMAGEQIVSVEGRARDRGHVGSYCQALIYLGIFSHIGRTADANRLSQLGIEVAEQHGLKLWAAGGAMLSGIALNAQQRYAESVEKLAAVLKTFQAVNAFFLTPYSQAIYAASLSALGRLDEATEVERTAIIATIEPGSEQWFAAEVYRVIADADYWHRGTAEKAIQGLERAIDIAKAQDAKLWELRASVSLARIQGDRGERARGIALLTPVADNFPLGGRDLADMAEARTLLRELA